MTWVQFSGLAYPNYFFVTKDIYGIESELAEHGCERQTDSIHFSRRFEYPWAWLQIPENVQRHLDAGGGAATFQYLLARFIPSVTNVDHNPMWVEKVNEVKRRTGMFQNLDVVHGDIADLSRFPDKWFGSTTCISVVLFSDTATTEKILDELLRVTGGPVLMSVDVGEGDELMSLADLFHLSQRYEFLVPFLPPDVMNCTTYSGKAFKVACIRLEGGR